MAALQETSQVLSLQVVSGEERVSRCEADLRVEREWRCDLQDNELKAKEQVNTLQVQIKKMHDDLKGQDRMRNELERLKKQWSEAQTTLEELGIQLSVSKLQVAELQEKIKINEINRQHSNDGIGTSGVWSPDNSTSECKGCKREFSLTRRKVSISRNKLYVILIYMSMIILDFSITAEIVETSFATAVPSK